jgi:hypothetical protein
MREREPEAAPIKAYEALFERMARNMEVGQKGRVVIEGDKIPWDYARQAILRYYVDPLIKDTALLHLDSSIMHVFMQEIRTRSGRHTHQGGLAIFVVEGQGYTTVDGVRHDWKAGDLILLPIKKGGVEHQHFNTDPNGPSRWLALNPLFLMELMGFFVVQKEAHPDWKG